MAALSATVSQSSRPVLDRPPGKARPEPRPHHPGQGIGRESILRRQAAARIRIVILHFGNLRRQGRAFTCPPPRLPATRARNGRGGRAAPSWKAKIPFRRRRNAARAHPTGN